MLPSQERRAPPTIVSGAARLSTTAARGPRRLGWCHRRLPVVRDCRFCPSHTGVKDGRTIRRTSRRIDQTCDLVNQKVPHVVAATALDAESLVTTGKLKTADVRGPICAGPVFGWYFLPKSDDDSTRPTLVATTFGFRPSDFFPHSVSQFAIFQEHHAHDGFQT